MVGAVSWNHISGSFRLYQLPQASAPAKNASGIRQAAPRAAAHSRPEPDRGHQQQGRQPGDALCKEGRDVRAEVMDLAAEPGAADRAKHRGGDQVVGDAEYGAPNRVLEPEESRPQIGLGDDRVLEAAERERQARKGDVAERGAGEEQCAADDAEADRLAERRAPGGPGAPPRREDRQPDERRRGQDTGQERRAEPEPHGTEDQQAPRCSVRRRQHAAPT